MRGSSELRQTRRTLGTEAEPESGRPAPPADMGEIARAEWDRIIGELADLGLATPLDGSALAVQVCDPYEQYQEAKRKVRESGLTIVTGRGEMVSPLVRIMDGAWQRYLKGCDRFGLSPSARTQARVQAAKKVVDSKRKYFADTA